MTAPLGGHASDAAPSAPESIKTLVMLAAVEWSFVSQAQHVFARRFAARGIRVVFVEPFPHRYPDHGELRKVVRRFVRFFRGNTRSDTETTAGPEGIRVIAPLALPETSWVARWLNRLLFVPIVVRRVHAAVGRPDIIQVWKPLDGFAAVARALCPRTLVYCCVDNYAFEYRAPRHYGKVEAELVRRADLVAAKGGPLFDRLRLMRPDTRLREPAVDFVRFSHMQPASGECRSVCYFGAISDRLDYDILAALAQNGVKVILIGPLRRAPWTPSSMPSNTSWHSQVEPECLPELLQAADALILPYKLSAYTNSINPAKLYECLATGKPLLATRLPSLHHLSRLIYFVSDGPDAVAALKAAGTEPAERVAERKAVASAHDWGKLVADECEWMMSALSKGVKL